MRGRKLLRVGLGAFVSLALGIAGFVLIAYVSVERRLDRRYSITAEHIALPNDLATLEQGRHIARAVAGCRDCHGEDLGGKVVLDDPFLGRLAGSNLTSGKGGVVSAYSDADYVRAILHGVHKDGTPIPFMPSDEYRLLSDQDVAALIVYLRTLPPVDRTPPKSTLRMGGRILMTVGILPPVAAERIQHADQTRPKVVAKGPTKMYGNYLVSMCRGCHGQNLAGGPIPGVPPAIPPAADLRAKTLARYSEADFRKMMRTGTRPDGSKLNDFMPWKNFSEMTDDELHALWLVLRDVPEDTMAKVKPIVQN